MKFLRTALAFCMCITLQFAYGQKEKFSQVKIFIPKSQVARLQMQGVDIDHAYYNSTEQSLTTTLSQRDIQLLKNAGLSYKITIDDEEQDFLKRNNPKDFFKYDNSRNGSNNTNAMGRLMFNAPDKSFASTIVTPAAFNAGSMGGYLTLAEMKKELDSMKLNFSSLVRIDTIGYTYGGRPIWAVKISDNASTDEDETEVLFTGMHHAREPLAMENLIFFMQYLLENYATNSRIKEIVDNRELVFIPCLNPDGYYYNQTTNPSGGGMWRKNRQPNPSSSYIGQDLNRNYGYGFDYPNGGSSDDPSLDNYHGETAFQAYETQIIRDYLRLHNFHIAINYHSYGGYWIHGNTVPTYSLSATDSAVIKTTGAFATRSSLYDVGTPMETVGYNGNGTVEDWCMAGDAGIRPKVYSISPEVGLGLGTFWPSSSSVIGYCKEVMFGNLQAALFGGAYVDAADRTSLNVTSKTGNLSVYVRRIGLVDSSVKVTILPIFNMTGVGGPVTINSISSFQGTATANISYTLHPSITNGQQFSYVIKTETSGITTLDTIVKFYNATVPVQDNMDAGVVGTLWSTTSWDYSTASAFSGTRSLSESSTGNYSSSKTWTITANATMNFTGTKAAYLSFWTRYRSQPGYDKLQVKISTDGGTTYSSPLPGRYTIAENKGTMGGNPSFTGYQDYWVREIIDLKTALNASAVKIRFEFTSDASGTDDGFYLDDLEIVSTNTAMITLPVHFLDVKAVRVGKEASIRWESQVDASHLYFEVEKSVDAINFSSIYKTTDKQTVLYATDANPITGINYYRIKAVSTTGAEYSKTVSVAMGKNTSVSIYPNPAANQLSLDVNGLTVGTYQMQFINQAGQIVSYREVKLTGSESTITLPINGLSAGNYQLCLRDDKGELVDVKKFVKL